MTGYAASRDRIPAALLLTAALLSACSPTPPPAAPEYEGTDWVRSPTSRFPPRLSQSGLFTDIGSQEPGADLVEYRVRFPRFVGGHAGRRALYLPPGSQIDASDADAWIFPAGTTFSLTYYAGSATADDLRGEALETRVLHRSSRGWKAAAYRWREDGSDADRLKGREDLSFRLRSTGDTYTIPKTLSCLSCHQNENGWILGFNGLQLDLHDGSDVEGEQLASLTARGIFASDTPPAFTSIDGRSDLETEVLGYWQGNCVPCHRPGSTAYKTTELDLRHPSALVNTIDVEPRRLGTAIPGMRLVSPRRPDSSLLYILTTGSYSDPAMTMPQLGTSLLDTSATERLRQWIESL